MIRLTDSRFFRGSLSKSSLVLEVPASVFSELLFLYITKILILLQYYKNGNSLHLECMHTIKPHKYCTLGSSLHACIQSGALKPHKYCTRGNSLHAIYIQSADCTRVQYSAVQAYNQVSLTLCQPKLIMV